MGHNRVEELCAAPGRHATDEEHVGAHTSIHRLEPPVALMVRYGFYISRVQNSERLSSTVLADWQVIMIHAERGS